MPMPIISALSELQDALRRYPFLDTETLFAELRQALGAPPPGNRRGIRQIKKSGLPRDVTPHRTSGYQVRVAFGGKRYSAGCYDHPEVAGAVAQILRQGLRGPDVYSPHPGNSCYDTALMDLLGVLS